MVVHKDLHPELIYLLAQTLKEEHGGPGVFHRAGDFPTSTDPELVMADGAQDFYKNGPSLLQKYLPFWMINLTKRTIAVLVAGVAVIVPLMNYAPKLYQSLIHSQVAKLYRRLRVLEAELQKGRALHGRQKCKWIWKPSIEQPKHFPCVTRTYSLTSESTSIWFGASSGQYERA